MMMDKIDSADMAAMVRQTREDAIREVLADLSTIARCEAYLPLRHVYETLHSALADRYFPPA